MNKLDKIFKSEILISLILFLSVFAYINNHVYLYSDPQGIHFARQMDAFAFTKYFSDHHFNLAPGNLNLDSIDGKSASEFPVVYYLVSFLFFLFGEDYIFLKLITVFSLFVAFHFTIKLVSLFITHKVTYYALALIFYSSTVLQYYGNLCLPDIHSLAFCMMGLYFLFSFNETGKKRQLIFAFTFLTLASLIKASFFYYLFFAFTTVFFLPKMKLLLRPLLVYFFVGTVAVFIWYSFVRHYNHVNGNWYFTTSIKPFWTASESKIKQSLDFIGTYWYSKYYFQSTFHFFYGLFVFYLLFIRNKVKRNILIFSVLSLLSLFYVSVFLTQFIHHDYYIIALLPSLFIIIGLMYSEFEAKVNPLLRKAAMFFLVLLSCLSINYVKLNLYRRYTNNVDRHSIVSHQLHGVRAYLVEHGVKENCKMVVIGDLSRNGSLGFLGHYGWAYPSFEGQAKEKIQAPIESSDYLVLLSPSQHQIPLFLVPQLDLDAKLEYNNNFIIPIIH